MARDDLARAWLVRRFRFVIPVGAAALGGPRRVKDAAPYRVAPSIGAGVLTGPRAGGKPPALHGTFMVRFS